MKTILTIDFDIIMEPSIRIYNSLVNGQIYLENLPENNLLQFAKADLNIYRKITSYLLKICKNTEIIFIENHDQVLDFLEDDEKYDIINIDHHHDLGYGEKQINPKEDEDYNCANWVLMTYDKNVLNSYKWIRNNNSILPKEDNRCPYTDQIIDTTTLSELPQPDKIILCYSAQWVPQTYRPLFMTWVDLLSDYTGQTLNIERGNY